MLNRVRSTIKKLSDILYNKVIINFVAKLLRLKDLTYKEKYYTILEIIT